MLCQGVELTEFMQTLCVLVPMTSNMYSHFYMGNCNLWNTIINYLEVFHFKTVCVCVCAHARIFHVPDACMPCPPQIQLIPLTLLSSQIKNTT